MLTVEIPGRERLAASHLVLDLNGTLATDGQISPEITNRVRTLGSLLQVHILTADTHGTAATLKELGAEIVVVGPGDQVEAKAALIRGLGPHQTVAVGNGLIDEAMLREAVLSIVVVGREGAAVRSLLAADLVVRSIEDALDLFLLPKRLIASLRTA